MIKINIISDSLAWRNYLKKPKTYIENCTKKLNKKFRRYNKVNIICTLLLSEDKEIKKLNKKFRKKNTPTDVLSFPFYKKKELFSKLKNEKEVYLGDIIINLNQIKNKNKNTNFENEFKKLWIHGLVHLLGHDHKKDQDFYKMRKLEIKFLSYLN